MQIEKFLALAERRNNRVFPQLLGQDESGNSKVYWPAARHKQLLIQAILHACVTRVKVKGLDNLYDAAGLSEENQVIVVSNHLADFDHPLKHYFLCRVGLGGFADRLVFPAGLKMIERLHTRIFMPGENSLFVMTPFDARDLANAKADYDSLSSAKRAIIDKYRHNFACLTIESAREMIRLRKEGMIFVSYPEATRSRTGRLGSGQEAVTAHFPRNGDKVFVVSMMLDGINRFNPPERPLCLVRTEVSMAVGKSYPVKDIWFREGKHATRRLAIDRVMARLAVLEPGLVSPEDMVFYSTRLNGYDPNIEAQYQYLPGLSDRILGAFRMVRDSLGQTRIGRL